jgi:glutathione-independent formaldehyde dehydrogenase
MVRGRTTERGLVLGHEITGEAIEWRDVEFIKKGDIVSVPFNACGRCQKCKNRFDRYLFKCNECYGGAAGCRIWVVGSEVKQNTVI